MNIKRKRTYFEYEWPETLIIWFQTTFTGSWTWIVVLGGPATRSDVVLGFLKS
jgi:hypothetical protein